MRTSKVAVAALSLTVIAGCASTKVTSVRDPAFQGRQFQRVVVAAPFTDLDKKAATENEFVRDLQARGVQAVAAMVALPPTRTYSNDEISAALKRMGADGVLFVTLTDFATTTTYVPGSTTTTGSAYATGNTVNWTATTRQDPGYYIHKPRVAFEMKLVDAASGNVAWLGTSFTKGNAFAGWGTLMGSLAGETVDKMVADGVVR